MWNVSTFGFARQICQCLCCANFVNGREPGLGSFDALLSGLDGEGSWTSLMSASSSLYNTYGQSMRLKTRHGHDYGQRFTWMISLWLHCLYMRLHGIVCYSRKSEDKLN